MIPPLTASGERLLLLADAFSPHFVQPAKDYAATNHTTLLSIPEKCTAWVQPIDCNIVKSFKECVRPILDAAFHRHKRFDASQWRSLVVWCVERACAQLRERTEFIHQSFVDTGIVSAVDSKAPIAVVSLDGRDRVSTSEIDEYLHSHPTITFDQASGDDESEDKPQKQQVRYVYGSGCCAGVVCVCVSVCECACIFQTDDMNEFDLDTATGEQIMALVAKPARKHKRARKTDWRSLNDIAFTAQNNTRPLPQPAPASSAEHNKDKESDSEDESDEEEGVGTDSENGQNLSESEESDAERESVQSKTDKKGTASLQAITLVLMYYSLLLCMISSVASGRSAGAESKVTAASSIDSKHKGLVVIKSGRHGKVLLDIGNTLAAAAATATRDPLSHTFYCPKQCGYYSYTKSGLTTHSAKCSFVLATAAVAAGAPGQNKS